MVMEIDGEDLLRQPSNQDYPTLTRSNCSYNPLPHFDLPKGERKHYRQQYGDMYFLRLAKLKPAVEAIAENAWNGYELAGEIVRKVERVLDVRQGQLCWIAGTVYMDMPLKPNILDDISKDHWIAAPPAREKYISPDGEDKVMLEDESGRLRLTGAALQGELLVTGCIIAAMGTENANGDFEVIDIKVSDLPTQPERWAKDKKKNHANGSTNGSDVTINTGSSKVAIVSGLAISGERGDSLQLDLFMEWLSGESGSTSAQHEAARVSRLIIAGNSLAEGTPPSAREDLHPESKISKKASASKKYGYDASAYNPAPTTQLDDFLSTLLPSIPITLIPGASDPANVSLPQQPLHPALFPKSRAYAAPPTSQSPSETGTFHSTTNPCFFTLAGHLCLGTGGQPINDISKYLEPAPSLEMLEATLRWRLLAPTAPDTLWCYPFQSDDPFVLDDGMCPHLYFTGDQDEFGTELVEGPGGQSVRIISVPRFSETGEVVIVDLDTLEVEVMRFSVYNHQNEE